jgi:hypothetical protein
VAHARRGVVSGMCMLSMGQECLGSA